MTTQAIKRYSSVLAALVAVVALVSCSDDDPVGPVIPDSPIPIANGTTYQYQLAYNVGVDDTCDVLVEAMSASTKRTQRTRWVFDYHGVYDTLYTGQGNDSVIQYIGLVPPPDTASVLREGNQLILEDFPLCEVNRLVIDFPLYIGKTWDPLGVKIPYLYNYSGTASVDSLRLIEILGQSYEAYKAKISIHGVSTLHQWNHLVIDAYIVPGVGLVAMYNTLYEEAYPNRRFLGIVAWKLIPSTN